MLQESLASERCTAGKASAPCHEAWSLSPALLLDAEDLGLMAFEDGACDYAAPPSSSACDCERPAPSCAGAATTSGARTGSVSREDAQAQLEAALASLVVYPTDDEDAYYSSLGAYGARQRAMDDRAGIHWSESALGADWWQSSLGAALCS